MTQFEKDVYNNTRIIIVSDHGFLSDNIMQQIEYVNAEGEKSLMDTGCFNCVLLVKDFDSNKYTVNNEMISNADTPALATKGILNDPTNPFSGNKISTFNEQETPAELSYKGEGQVTVNNGNVFMPSDWFTVKDNIYDPSNWRYLGFH